MVNLKPAVKVLGLLALLLCVAAAVAGPASATTVANWKVKGVNVTAELSPTMAVKEIEAKDAILLTKIAGKSLEFLCTELQPINVKLKPEGVVAFEAGLKFTGCVTKVAGVVNGSCEPVSGGKEPGVIISNTLKGALVEHEGSGIVRFEPVTGESFGNIMMGEECAFGEKVSLLGKFTLKDTALGTETETHLFSQGPLTELWVISKTEEHKVTVDGSIVVKLAGAHTGLLWSGGFSEVPVETPVWKVKGAEVTASLKPLVAVKEIESGDAILLSKVGGAKVEILCTGAQLSGMKLEPKGVISSGSQIKFSGCVTKLNEKISGTCEPSNEGKEPGAIASTSLKGLLISHEGSGVVQFEPSTGENLAVVETTKECSIGEKIPVLGKFTLKDASLSTEAATHLLSSGPLTELWLVSKTEEHKVTIDGSGVARLASTHAEMLWSGTVPKPKIPAWKVKGVNVTAELSPAVAVKEIEAKDAILLTKLAGKSLEFLCTELQPINVKLKPEGVVAFEAGLKFTGCVTKVAGVVNGACEPVSGGTEPGVIISNTLKGALVAHEGSAIVRFEPVTGESFGSIKMGEECAFGETVSLIGKFTLKDTALGTETENHLFSAGPLTELWVNSKTEEHKVTVDGSIVARLGGAHAGMLWSGSL